MNIRRQDIALNRGDSESTGSLIESMCERVDFSSDRIQVMSVTDVTLPLERSPVRVAVLMKNGSVSNSWRIFVAKSGDAYIACRDNLRGQKVSLHCSGKQHIAFDKSVTELPDFSGSRFMNQWREPRFHNHAVPTFDLLFPNWGIGLTPKQILQSESKWKKNELLIIGHEKDMTVISFYIVDDNRKMIYRGPKSVIPLCKLTLRPSKTLHVFALRQSETNLRDLIQEKVFPHVVANFGNRALQRGSYTMSVTGERGATRYMVTFPVDYTPPC